MRVGYVVSAYPSVSHTFVLREVLGLRAVGVQVDTFTVRRTTAAETLTDVERGEQAKTEAILPRSAPSVAASHLRALRRSPIGYARTLRLALGNAPPGARKLLWQLFYFAEAIILWDRAERKGLTHLHAHLTNVAADLAWLAVSFGNHAEPGRWRWSMTVHGPTEFFDVVGSNLARKCVGADLVVCISNFCRSQLMGLVAPQHWSKLVIVHCGADLSRYPFRPGQRRPGDPLRILCIGRLVPEKGQALLIPAVERLVAGGVAASVTFAGGGPDRGPLEALAGRSQLGSGAVSFLGPVSQDQLPAIHADHHCLCLPSFAEGVPVVLMEAMASGLPVVSTRIAGIPELITDGTSGRLVSAGSLDELTRALVEVATNTAANARHVEEARRTVEDQFDAAANAATLREVFEAIV